jgi:hypothetical protein
MPVLDFDSRRLLGCNILPCSLSRAEAAAIFCSRCSMFSKVPRRNKLVRYGTQCGF